MLHEAVADLLRCKPHEPADATFTVEQWDVYAAGYRMALVKALQTMQAAEERYRLYIRTRRLATRQKREQGA
jgi:hypothetical protein